MAIAISLVPRISFCQNSYLSAYPVWHSGTTARTTSVALGDIDLDGDLDLLCGNSLQSSTLFLNENGVFQTSPAWSSGSADDTRAIALGDIDGDGDLDLVCGNYGQPTTLYVNDGGVLETAPAWSSLLEDSTTSVALGDVDGDGDLDLVCGNYAQTNRLYLNTDGMFEPSPSWSARLVEHTQSVALGDVDEDGYLDLVCGNADLSSSLYLNAGGTFEGSASWLSGSVNTTRVVVLGDLNGDGRVDLVCAHEDRGNTLYLNIGGTFETAPSWSSTDARQIAALGDMDGDDDLDLVCSSGLYRPALKLNDGGTFNTSNYAWISEMLGPTTSVALGDVDGDGDVDLVCGKFGTTTLYRNESCGFETTATWRGEGAVPALADVDGDGDLDLVCARADSYGAINTMYLNNGVTLDTIPSWTSGPVEYTNCMDLGDIDGDGDLDLVCGNGHGSGASATCYWNIGGTFETMPSWSSDPTPYTCGIALGDVDLDGDLDLVCGNGGYGHGESNTLFLNDGGAFESTPSWSSGLAERTTSIALGDIDSDGDLDLVCGNYYQRNTLYRNVGGTFEAMPSWYSDFPEFTTGIDLGDVDGDGDLDLISGNGGNVYTQANTLYLNTGTTFQTGFSWSGPPDYTLAVRLWDIDGDGDLDFVCGNSAECTLFRNAGGALGNTAGCVIDSPAYAIALGDIDRDGDPDLVAEGSVFPGKTAPVYKGDPLAPKNQLPNNGAHLRFALTDTTSPGLCRVSFGAVDVESDPIWVLPEYQFEGETVWYSAVIGGRTGIAGPFVTSPAGVRDSLDWETRLLPFDTRDVVLRLRVIEIPRRVSIVQHAAAYVINLGHVTPYRPVISTTDALSFPAVTVGDTTSARLQVTNRGAATLAITGIDLPTPDLQIENAPPISVAPRDSVELTILFSPRGEADISGSLVIQSDDPFSPSTVVSLSADVRPLEFTLANLYPGGEISEETPLNISVTMQDSVRVDSARVFFRKGGRASFEVIRLRRIDDPVNEQYYGSIPAPSITPRGIEYFVEVHKDRFTRSGDLRRLRTRVQNLLFDGAPPPERYGMISLPLAMDGPILGVVSDDLGGQDIAQWRLWGYEGAGGTYAELPNDTTTHFDPGRGYWLITRSAPPIDTGPAEGLSTPTDAPFEIVLGPGWNMVGNPFAFPVAWSGIEVDTLTMAEAEAQGVLEPLWRWVPSTGRYEQDVEVLAPFEGYWVKNTTDPAREIVLRVAPVEASAGALYTEVASEEDGSWEVGIHVTCADAGSRHNRVGVRSSARDVRDIYDRFEPPMGPGASVSLYFPHLAWEKYGGRYAVDIRGGERNEGHAWTFDVAKNFSRETAGDEVVLEFSGLEAVPEDVEVLLVDRTLGRTIDLRKEGRHSFYQGRRGYVARDKDARFALLVGSEDFIETHEDGIPKAPTQTVLHQNRPNPFNPSTIIQYELAQPGHVTVKIYDVSGALVRTLEERERQPGRYEIGWNAEDDRGSRVSSGVYFYRMETHGFTQTRKLVILK